mgnify:CR=1 FL=1
MMITGTFCASLTPFNDDLSINNEVLFDHCKEIINKGADKIAIFGTTGEANLISSHTKMNPLEVLIQKGFDASNLLPGTGLVSLKETIVFSKFASDNNMAGVLLLPSYYYKNPTDEGLIDYFSRIVEEVGNTDFKYLLYHIPQISGVGINLSVIENLLKKYPKNIVGIKDSSNDLENMKKMITTFPNFSVLSGSDSLAMEVMRLGGGGAITATANLSVSLLSKIVKYAKDSSKDEIVKKMHILQDQIRKLVFSQEQISFMKAVLNILSQSNHWTNIMPPLKPLKDFKNNQNISKVLGLLEEMKNLTNNS